MDKDWVDRSLAVLLPRREQLKPFRFFEPTPAFYARLETGEDSDLWLAVAEVGRYLNLPTLPPVSYEWQLRMLDRDTLGQIRSAGTSRSQIQIPLFAVGKPLMIGVVSAHELMHEFLARQGIWVSNREENEHLTDLAAIAFGLGKLMLNGTVSEPIPGIRESLGVGYLAHDLRVYAYQQVAQHYGISGAALMDNLTPGAVRLLEIYSQPENP
jgi:hypothetical protein